MCVCISVCVSVCVRWVVGHLQLQAVCVRPNGKVLFSLCSKGPRAVCGGYLFTLSLGTLLYGQYTHTHAHTEKISTILCAIHQPVWQRIHNLTAGTQQLLLIFLDTGGCMLHMCLSPLMAHADTNTHLHMQRVFHPLANFTCLLHRSTFV